ncbi:MAG TPA: hypothetical protein VGG06_11390 [Thermoanaerobaculia bacterium]|jgi:hypothetical protein
MPALAFDTHAYVKKLREAGVPEAQAEVQIEAIVAILEKRMVTKEDLELRTVEIQRDIKELDVKLSRDLKELDAKLEREIAEVRRDIKELEIKLSRDLKELEVKLEREIAGVRRDIKELEMRLLVRLGALLVVGIGAIATLIKLL